MEAAKNQLISTILTNIKSSDGDVLSQVKLTFSTVLNPMFSSPIKIREIAGSYLTEISDDVLNRLILKYSLEARTMAVCDTANWSDWFYYASKWVALKVSIDSIYNSPTFLGLVGGKVYKKLGDFALSKDSGDSSENALKKFLEKLECEAFKIEVSVRSCKEPLLTCDAELEYKNGTTYSPKAATTVKKGSKNPQPIIGRTFRKDGRHPQWTGYIQELDKYYMTNRR